MLGRVAWEGARFAAAKLASSIYRASSSCRLRRASNRSACKVDTLTTMMWRSTAVAASRLASWRSKRLELQPERRSPNAMADHDRDTHIETDTK